MQFKTAIAIPDSTLVDEVNQLEKTRKISLIARACAIFGIDEIYIYHESAGTEKDAKFMISIFRYLETPQYFRKKLFPKTGFLKNVGVLPPLKIPHHNTSSNPKKIKRGDIREGIIVSAKGKQFVDVGIKQLLPYYGKEKMGKRVTVQFKNGYPNFSFKLILKDEVGKYWGYKVKEHKNLFSLLNSWIGNIILTSRKGRIFSKQNTSWYSSNKPTLIVFGSPKRGLYEILGNQIKNIQNAIILNFFPNQATETVRLDEAVLGVLSILNVVKGDNI